MIHFQQSMNKGDLNSADAAIDALLSVGTVRGVCLARGADVLVNRFPFSDGRLLKLCVEVEQILEEFAERGRSVERMVFGFDGGHLVIQLVDDVRLLIMHLIPDEADFVAKAGRAFLADHREAIANMEAIPIELEMEAEAETEIETEAKPMVEKETETETQREAPEEEAALVVEADDDAEKVAAAAAAAAEARNVQSLEQEDQHQAVPKPEIPELPMGSSLPEEGSRQSSGFRELLEASRQQEINDAVLAASSEEGFAETKSEIPDEDRSLAAWAAEHLELPADSSHLLQPKQSSQQSQRSSAGRPVLGAVRVQPVRLAAQQPQSTLPPPKKPRVRRERETVEEG